MERRRCVVWRLWQRRPTVLLRVGFNSGVQIKIRRSHPYDPDQVWRVGFNAGAYELVQQVDDVDGDVGVLVAQQPEERRHAFGADEGRVELGSRGERVQPLQVPG